MRSHEARTHTKKTHSWNNPPSRVIQHPAVLPYRQTKKSTQTQLGLQATPASAPRRAAKGGEEEDGSRINSLQVVRAGGRRPAHRPLFRAGMPLGSGNGRGSEGVSGTQAGEVRNTNTPAAAARGKRRKRCVGGVGAEEQRQRQRQVAAQRKSVRSCPFSCYAWPWWFVRGRCGVGLAQRTIPYQTTTGVGSAGPRRVLDGCSEAGAELDSSRS
jgi:hypothetical protein